MVRVFPNQSSVVKLLKGDFFELKIESDASVVEAWTNLNNISFKNIRLRKRGKSFCMKTKLNQTGFFQMFIRSKINGNWQKQDPLEIHVDPDWVKNAIVYNVFVRFFAAEKVYRSGIITHWKAGTFDDVKKKLDSLKRMGVNTLYLNPIHLIGELFRNYNPHDLLPSYLQPGSPYSIKDYKSIDPELAYDRDRETETLSDPFLEFHEFVRAAHKKGFRVILDLVFNHCAHDAVFQRLHPEWFLYKENITSLNDPYIYPEEIGKKPWGDAKHTFAPYDHGFWWQDAAQLNWEYKIPPASNNTPKNPTLKLMWAYFKSIPKYWVRQFGIDGFRCDVAYRIPTQFWKECISETRAVAKEEKRDVIFIAESYADNLKELHEAGFTAVYGDFSNKLYNPEQLKNYLDFMYNLNGRWFIFPECHDFHRSAKKYAEPYTKHELADFHANKSRWVLTACLPGIPLIFNGFEKIEWHPINLFSYSQINWEGDKDLREFISKVNLIRHENKALQEGKYLYIHSNQELNDKTQLFCFARTLNKEKVIVAVNMDIVNKIDCATITLPDELGINFKKSFVLHDVLNNKNYKRKGQKILICLDPGESHIFVVKSA